MNNLVKRINSTILVVVILISQFNFQAYSESRYNDSLGCEDTVTYVDDHFRVKQVLLPATLIAAGAIGVYNGAFRRLCENIQDEVSDVRSGNYFRIDDYIQYAPIASYLGLGAIGVKCKHGIRDRLAAGATAYLAMGTIVNISKYVFREKRPDSDARTSFPSGHTATAFMGAELIRLEYGEGLSIGAYVVATGVALLRIYNNRHWFNDVIAGAGVGILSARIGYWMLPLYHKWFGWNKSSMVMVIPNYVVPSRTFGVCMAVSF